jgi:AraC-like DNA-binding protein
MDSLLNLAITFALSQVVLSALLLARSKSRNIRHQLYAILLVAITAYLLTPVTTNSVQSAWLTAISTAVPGMFWLFSASLFDDHFRLQRWQVLLVSLTVLPPALDKVLQFSGIVGPHWLLITLPQLLEFVLLGLTLAVVARHWRVDLIESRRSLRLWFCALNGVYLFVLIFVREVVFPEVDWMRPMQYVPVGGILLATNALLLEYKPGILADRPRRSTLQTALEGGERAAVAQPAFQVPQQILQQLQQLMEAESYYKESGLTIGRLAARLDLPDHRLRMIINTGLGYRNFNDFLNSYRVKETSRRLANPAEKHLPVLTIALETGFRSLSSFNKAFKEAHNMTPTAYRRQQLGEAASV